MGKKSLTPTAKDVLNLPDEEFVKLFENDKFLNNLNDAYAMLPNTDKARIAELLCMSKEDAEKALSTEKPFVKTRQEKRKGGEEEEDDGMQDDDTMDGEAEEWDTTDGESEEDDSKDGESEDEDSMDGEAEEEDTTVGEAQEGDMDKAVKSK